MPGYLTAEGIEQALQHLITTYPSLCRLIPLPEPSWEGRNTHAVAIGSGGGDQRPGVLLLGGVHAREIVNPDLLVSLALKLCHAYSTHKALKFGGKTYQPPEIDRIVETLDLFVFPLVNPDGRAFVQSPSGDVWWRKNRNPNQNQPCQGVDINRNFDFLFNTGIGTSADPCSEVFKGEGAFSEPETRNVRWMLDANTSIEFLIDVHSYSEDILYPWGDDDDQTTDPTMNFMNPAFDGQRGVHGQGYREYLPKSDLDWFVQVGDRMQDAIEAVRGRRYALLQSIGLYPTTGTSDDYAYSRHFVNAGMRKVRAYTVETAREFQPPFSEGRQVISEVSAGLLEFCLAVSARRRAAEAVGAPATGR